MIYLRAIKRNPAAGKGRVNGSSEYPLSAPVMAALARLEFTNPVTILAGDNGCGKTTLLELLASKLSALRIDAGDALKAEKFYRTDQNFRIELTARPSKNFLFQAEDFIRYIDNLNQMREEAKEDIRRSDDEFRDKSDYVRGLARMPYMRTLAEIEALYDCDISELSHGESFITFFGARITQNGLYLLDEPEAALSAYNQYVFLNLIEEAVQRDCQLIISTHSPIIMAYPGACIYQITDGRIEKTEYEEVENVKFLKSFINDKDGYLKFLKGCPEATKQSLKATK